MKGDQQARKAKPASAGMPVSLWSIATDGCGISRQPTERKPACWRSGADCIDEAQWCMPRRRQHAGNRFCSAAAGARGATSSKADRVSSSSAQNLCTSLVCHTVRQSLVVVRAKAKTIVRVLACRTPLQAGFSHLSLRRRWRVAPPDQPEIRKSHESARSYKPGC